MKEKHYCFNIEKKGEAWGRVHVPLARKCSLHCLYCNYYYDRNISNIGRPGVTENVVEGEIGITKYLAKKFIEYPETKIIGISGPGDPLENIEQVNQLINIVKRDYPWCILCICTNGRIYNDQVDKVLSQDILQYITLTINTMNTEKYPDIYKLYQNEKIEYNLWSNQLKIIRACVRRNIKVKINTVFLKGINDSEIFSLYRFLLEEGVYCFNLIPHISFEDGKQYCRDENEYEKVVQELVEQGFPMMTRCKHCRADYCEHGIRRESR